MSLIYSKYQSYLLILKALILPSNACDFKRPALFRTLKYAFPLLSLFFNLEHDELFLLFASSWGSSRGTKADVSDPINGFWFTTSSLESIKEEEIFVENGDVKDGFKDIVLAILGTFVLFIAQVL